MKYLVISHGPMAKGSVESVEMILGPQSYVYSLSVTDDSTIISMYQEIVNTISKDKDEWIILTDIIGGTPFNAAYKFLSEYNNAIIVTGFNLPLLIELFMQPNLKLEDAVDFIKQCQPNTMSIVDKVEIVASNLDNYDL